MKIEQEMTWQELFLKSLVYMKFSSRKSFDPSLYMYMYSEQVVDGSFTPFEQYFNKITFDEMMMSVLYQTHTISWMLPLAHWNNSPPVNISLNSHSSSRFRAHQSFALCRWCCVLSGKATTNFIDRDSNPRKTWLGSSMLTITLPKGCCTYNFVELCNIMYDCIVVRKDIKVTNLTNYV